MTSSTAVRGEYAKSALRRQQIVEAALAVFAEGGFEGSTLQAVAARVGMTKPGMMHHFASKEALLAAVLELRDRRSYAHFGRLQDPGIGALEGLLALVATNAEQRDLVELHCRLSAEASSPGHPAHQYFRDRYAGLTQTIEASFRALEQEGRLRPGVDPHTAAIGVIAHVDGLQVHWLLAPERIDMAASVRAYLKLLVDAELSSG